MIDDLPMTRARLYVLIDAFERDVRSALQKYIVDEIGEEQGLGTLYDACSSKKQNDPAAGDVGLVSFLEMREGYDLLNTHRKSLPSELAVEVRELTQSLDRLVGIRNRVMHARPLAVGDSDAAVSLLSQFSTRYWAELRRTLAQLQADPTWEPVINAVTDESPTLHNLPLPDYDDTGLIGRSREVQELVKVLKRGREPVITITGEGGIGKTALAVEVAYQLVDDEEQPFEAVLWASLKYEKLTAYGVRGITGAARDIIGAVQPVGAALDSDFTGSIEELSELVDGFNILVILDNLETISGEEFRSLYNTLPDTLSYLITSRIGVGEYERRYPLDSLGDKDSLQLFNQFVRARRIGSLSRLTSETRVNVVKKLRYSPLAIKWFALAVEAGNDPVELIRRQDQLLEFCVRSVYNDLEKSAKEVLDALAVLSRPLAADELVVLLERPMDAISTGVQELMRGSLVRRESVGAPGELLFKIVLTDTATQFLSRRISPDVEFRRELESRDKEFRRSQEEHAKDIESRSLSPVVVRQRSEADAPACTVLRQALLLAKKGGNSTDVYAKIDLARRFNPDFWEVDRVEGFIHDSFGDLTGATVCYERAYSNASGADRAVVAHFFAGHLARKARDVKRAIDFAREAHEVLATSETGLALGNFLIWVNKFDSGIELLEQVVPQSKGRTRVIAISSLAEAWRRFAEAAGEDEKNFLYQFDRAWKGFDIAIAAIETGTADDRLRATAADCAAVAIRAALVCTQSGIRVPRLSERLTQLGTTAVRLVGSKAWPTLGIDMRKLAAMRGAPTTAKRVEEAMSDLNYQELPSGVDSTASNALIGEIVNVLDTFGFIRHPKFPENIFFHAGSVSPNHGIAELRPGTLVQFIPEIEGKGPRAVDVLPV